MDANNINMVAVGLEELGAEDFVTGNFFNGEIYIDEGKKTYHDLGYRRFNFINIWKALLSRISRSAGSEARSRHISGNLSGDGMQNGGLLIITQYGKRVLLNHHEDVPGDHVTNEQILEVLGISMVATGQKSDLTERQKELEEQPACEEECGLK